MERDELEIEFWSRYDYIKELEAEHFDPHWDEEPDLPYSEELGAYVVPVDDDNEIPF